MEDRWHGPEDPINEDLETTRKKRRGTDFLSQYLLRRKEQQGETTEEDNEEESEEKPMKFRRFFKGLFKRVVESPTDDSREEAPRSFSLESLFLGSQEKGEETPNRTLEDLPITQETEQPSLPAEAEPIDSTEAFEPAPMERTSALGEVPLATVAQERPEDVDQPEEQAPVFTERDYTESPTVEQIVPDDRTVFERAASQPIAEKEVVIERGPGMALPVVLVGAEYLARKKADRKLDAKYNERVGRIETESNREKLAKEQLTTLVEQNREQLEALKRDRGIEITRPEQSRPVERPVPHMENQTPERKAQPTIEKQEQQSSPAKTEVPETYKIMEQVAQAAEQDVPVERVFERSHEVKDDQSNPTGAVSVGAIVAERMAAQQVNGQPTSNNMPKDTSGLPVISDIMQTPAYKQAMQRGFWSAIIIIIIGTLAYLLK